MKISLNIDFDTEDLRDVTVLERLIESIRLTHDSINVQQPEPDYREAWIKCSWEVIAFAITVLIIHDGESEKGVYAFFESLCKASNQELCGKLTERSISSRVGRTVVICNKLGDFRLMSVAVRRKDQIKRVYVVPEAKEALLTLLQEDWGRDFNHYLTENGMDTVSVESLGLD